MRSTLPQHLHLKGQACQMFCGKVYRCFQTERPRTKDTHRFAIVAIVPPNPNLSCSASICTALQSCFPCAFACVPSRPATPIERQLFDQLIKAQLRSVPKMLTMVRWWCNGRTSSEGRRVGSEALCNITSILSTNSLPRP